MISLKQPRKAHLKSYLSIFEENQIGEELKILLPRT